MGRALYAAAIPALVIALAPATVAQTKPPGAPTQPGLASPGLVMPQMDSARGRKLFASKGCVVCHSINAAGGKDARPLDASTMSLPMNPFEFAARMWRGAEPMIALQRQELGDQIALTGKDLADIIAFVHDAREQKDFSEKDIPHTVKDIMTKAHPPGKARMPHGQHMGPRRHE